MKLLKNIMILYFACTFTWLIYDLGKISPTTMQESRAIGFEGFRFNDKTEDSVKDYVYNKAPDGDWVCVNVNGMTYKRAIEVCRHEVFHEIWAECGENNNLTNCINKYDIETKNGS